MAPKFRLTNMELLMGFHDHDSGNQVQILFNKRFYGKIPVTIFIWIEHKNRWSTNLEINLVKYMQGQNLYNFLFNNIVKSQLDYFEALCNIGNCDVKSRIFGWNYNSKQ